MIWAVLGLSAAALLFAGVAIAFSREANASNSESSKQTAIAIAAQNKADEFEDDLIKLNRFRGADKKEINAQRNEIEGLRRLLREHAPDGAAADQFERMLQDAAGKNGDGDEDDSDPDTMP